MSKKPKPFITKMQAEGTHAERRVEHVDARRQAHEMVANMPSDKATKQAYIHNLVTKALKKEVSQEAFEEFMNLTDIQPEVDNVLARARTIADRTRI